MSAYSVNKEMVVSIRDEKGNLVGLSVHNSLEGKRSVSLYTAISMGFDEVKQFLEIITRDKTYAEKNKRGSKDDKELT